MRRWIILIVLFLTAPVARADDIELISGETLRDVSIIERGAADLVIDHPLLGRLSIPLTSIRTVNGRPIAEAIQPIQPPAQAPPAQAAPVESNAATPVATPRPPEPDLPPIPPEEPVDYWRSTLEIGGNITQGSTETTNFTARFRTVQTKPTQTTRVDMNYRIATDRRQDGRNVNRADFGVFSEWRSAESRWTVFAQGRLGLAEYQAWDQRITASGGLGYLLLDIPRVDEHGTTVDLFKLTGRLGGGLRKEFGSEDEQLAPEGLVGVDIDYRISETQRVAGTSRYFPDLDTGGEYRIENTLDWTIDIDKLRGVSLRLGLQHEYDSQTPSDIPHNDLAARATLVINF